MSDHLLQAIDIISAGASDHEVPDPDPDLVHYSYFETTKCVNGQEHKVWCGMTGDTWPAFCPGCKKHAVAGIPEEEDW